MKKSLYPALEIEPVRISYWGLFIGIFIIALVFFVLGFCMQHYPKLTTVIYILNLVMGV